MGKLTVRIARSRRAGAPAGLFDGLFDGLADTYTATVYETLADGAERIVREHVGYASSREAHVAMLMRPEHRARPGGRGVCFVVLPDED